VKGGALQCGIPQLRVGNGQIHCACSIDGIGRTIENRDTLDFENLRDSMRDLAGSGGTLVHQHQRAAEFIQPLHLLLAACRFPGPLPGARRKLARNNGRDKKCKQGDQF